MSVLICFVRICYCNALLYHTVTCNWNNLLYEFAIFFFRENNVLEAKLAHHKLIYVESEEMQEDHLLGRGSLLQCQVRGAPI